MTIVDINGKALLHTNASMVGKVIAPRPNFQKVVSARFLEQIRLVFSPAEVYDVTYPLELNGEPFGTIRIGVQTVFLKSEVQTRLMKAVYISIALIFASLFLAAGISNLALGPLKQISLNLDSVSAGDADALSGDESKHDEYGLVTLENCQPGPPDSRQPGNFFGAQRQRGSAHGQTAGRPDAVRARFARGAGQRAGGRFPRPSSRGTSRPHGARSI